MYRLDWTELEDSYINAVSEDRAIVIQKVAGHWHIFLSILYGPVMALPNQFDNAQEAKDAADIMWNSLVNAVSSQMN